MWNELISFAFFILPAVFIIYCWKHGDILTFIGAMMISSVLASEGAGKVIPMFNTEVAGGSTYIPTIFILLALLAKKFSNRMAMRALGAVTFGMILFAVAQGRWLAFSFFTPTITTHAAGPSELAFKNAVLTTLMVYFGGLFILAVRKFLMDVKPVVRTWTPVFLDIVLTTPISVLAVSWGNPGAVTESLVVSTVMVRLILPVLLLSYVLWDTRGK